MKSRSIRTGLILCWALVFITAHAAPAIQGDLPAINIARLPTEARETLRLIKQGGPFPYVNDGIVFHNYERILPRKERGYYREYTVKTPFALGRGARRIVCGSQISEGDRKQDQVQEERSGTKENNRDERRESEHLPLKQFVRPSTLTEFPECFYTADHYQTFKRIREKP